jgi:hypothetical protein
MYMTVEIEEPIELRIVGSNVPADDAAKLTKPEKKKEQQPGPGFIRRCRAASMEPVLVHVQLRSFR